MGNCAIARLNLAEKTNLKCRPAPWSLSLCLPSGLGSWGLPCSGCFPWEHLPQDSPSFQLHAQHKQKWKQIRVAVLWDLHTRCASRPRSARDSPHGVSWGVLLRFWSLFSQELNIWQSGRAVRGGWGSGRRRLAGAAGREGRPRCPAPASSLRSSGRLLLAPPAFPQRWNCLLGLWGRSVPSCTVDLGSPNPVGPVPGRCGAASAPPAAGSAKGRS